MLFQRTALPSAPRSGALTRRGRYGYLESNTQGPRAGATSAAAPRLRTRCDHLHDTQPSRLRALAQTAVVRRTQSHDPSHIAPGPRVKSAPCSTARGDREPAAARSDRSGGKGER